MRFFWFAGILNPRCPEVSQIGKIPNWKIILEYLPWLCTLVSPPRSLTDKVAGVSLENPFAGGTLLLG